MPKTQLGDYISYGLGGTALGAGAGITAGSLINREGLATPVPTIAGAATGLGAGLLTAYLKNRNRDNIRKMDPGWYVTEQPLYQIPDAGGLKVRHSAHTILIPRKDAQKLLKEKEWQGTDHYDFVNKEGKPMTAFQISTHMDSRNHPLGMITFKRMQVPFRTELDPNNGDPPLSRSVRVPLKKNVNLIDVLRRLKKIETDYKEGKAPIYTIPPASKIKEPGKGGRGNCHDITNAILKNTEDLHNLQAWAPEGLVKSIYERPEFKRDRLIHECRKALGKSYLGEVLRYSLGGALGGGVIGGGLPLLYGLDEVNPRIDKKKERYRHIANAGIGGLAGAGVGGLLGTVVGIGNATLEKMRAQRQLEKLEKESSAKDYIIGGAGGAAIGTGAGMIANAITGRKLLDAPFLLGGLGLGTAGGLAVGLLRSHERKNQDMRVKPDSKAVYLGEDGKKHIKPGTYVGFAPARFLNEQQKYPFIDNNVGHAFIFEVSDSPFSVKDKNGRDVQAVKMENGDYVMSHEILRTKLDKGDPRSKNKYQSSLFTTAINGHVLTPELVANGIPEGFGARGTDEMHNIFRSINDDPGEDPTETYAKTYFYPVQYQDENPTSTAASRSQFMFDRAQRDIGNEPWYSFTDKSKHGVDRRDCQVYVSNLLHRMSLNKMIDYAKVKANIPRFLGTSLGADFHNGKKYDKVMGYED